MESALRQRLKREFAARFGDGPMMVSAAPGRVNLIGEHTDHNQGFVLPMALDRNVYLGFRARNDGVVRVHALDLSQDGRAELTAIDKDRLPRFMHYVIAPGDFMGRCKSPLHGFDGVLTSTVPIGGGVSSSSALVVAAALAFRHINQPEISDRKFTMLTGECEWHYSGVRGGIMDQYTSLHATAGCALLLDCRSLEARQVRLPSEKMAVLVADTRVKHELIGTPYNDRRSACERAAAALGVAALCDADEAMLETARKKMDDESYRRARHVIGENRRTLEAAEALAAGQVGRVGELVRDSHRSLRDDYEVSCEQLNVMVSVAEVGPGGLGARMMGGGFGGCSLVLVAPAHAAAMIEHLNLEYKKRTGIEPHVFATAAGPGAAVTTLD